jgi:hypothetical protein
VTKLIQLPCYGIEIKVADGSDTITSNLKGEDTPESEEEGRERLEFNRMIDGIEALILAAACEGIDVAAPAFVRAITVAVDAAGNKPESGTPIKAA